jgi:tRNA threonylcarbamoyladenosine biosynthesis protein TsaB
MIDARMNEVYAAWFRAHDGAVSRQSDDMVLPVSRLLDDIHEEAIYFGSGAKRYKADIVEAAGERAHFVSPETAGARASIVGFLAIKALAEGKIPDIDSLEPLYIRESQAIEKEKRREKQFPDY